MGNQKTYEWSDFQGLVSERQLALRWGMSVRSIQRMRARGTSPAWLRVGHAVRYRVEDILAFEETLIRDGRAP